MKSESQETAATATAAAAIIDRTIQICDSSAFKTDCHYIEYKM